MKNRILLISFIIVLFALVVGFILLKKYTEQQTESFLKPAIAKNEILKIMRAVLIYEQEQGTYPPSENLQLLRNYKPVTEIIFPEFSLTDPWGKLYIFSVPGQNNLPYSIISYGADGKTGGVDSNADLSSDETFKKYKENLTPHNNAGE